MNVEKNATSDASSARNIYNLRWNSCLERYSHSVTYFSDGDFMNSGKMVTANQRGFNSRGLMRRLFLLLEVDEDAVERPNASQIIVSFGKERGQ